MQGGRTLRILNEDDVEIQPDEVDYRLGTLDDDKLFVQHHEAQEYVPERSHYRPTKIYGADGETYEVQGEDDPNVVKDGDSFALADGTPAFGVDVELVVDQEEIQAHGEYDEYEDILRYRLFSDEELRERAEQEREAIRSRLMQEQLPTAMTMMFAAQPQMLADMSDSDVQSISTFVPEWTVGTEYVIGSVAMRNGVLYRCLQPNTAQGIYPPESYVAGWKRIAQPDEKGVYPWSRPLGGTDTYMKGDRVSYDGAYWTSDIDYNIWVPGEYGWTKED